MINETVSTTAATDDALLREGVFGQFAPQGIRYAYSMLRNQADAEDVTQEAFCRLWAANPEWKVASCVRLEERFAPLFFTAIRNQCIDVIRKRSRQNQVSLETTAEPSARPATDVIELETEVARLLEQLPQEWAEALQLKVNGKLSYQEIAEVLNVTHGQVRTWIYRARRTLEAGLKKSGLTDK